MSRKRDSDGLPKQDPARDDRENSSSMGSNLSKIDQFFYDESSKKAVARLAKGDRKVLIEMCTTLSPFILNLRERDFNSIEVSTTTRTYESIMLYFQGDRITSIRCGALDREWQFVLPTAITGFHRLKSLRIWNLQEKTIPFHVLSKLPNLEVLGMTGVSPPTSSEIVAKDLSRLTLPHFKSFTITFRSSVVSYSRSLHQWIKERVPSLESLWCDNLDFGARPISDELSFNNAMRFQNNLSQISFRRCNLDEGHLETLLCDALPNCATVISLRVSDNRIKSFRSIDQRLSNMIDRGILLKTTVNCFFCLGNPVCDLVGKTHLYPEEVDALCRILRAYSTTHAHHEAMACCVRSQLTLNRARRRLMTGAHRTSPWPLILDMFANPKESVKKRVLYKNKGPEDVATALFYLLRNGPVLLGRK